MELYKRELEERKLIKLQEMESEDQ